MIPLGLYGAAHVPASGGLSAYGSAVMADSPFCYLPLNGDAVDVAGNLDHTGFTITGVAWTGPDIGDGPSSATFDGGATNRGIRIPEAQLVTSISAFTIEVLSQPTNTSAQRAVIGRDNYYLLRHTNTGAWSGLLGAPSWANNIGTIAEASPTAIHHMAITWDGTTALMYRDGVQIASKAASAASISVAGKGLHIGSRNTVDPTFLGHLAGFSLNYSALSAARILAHAQAAGVA